MTCAVSRGPLNSIHSTPIMITNIFNINIFTNTLVDASTNTSRKTIARKKHNNAKRKICNTITAWEARVWCYMLRLEKISKSECSLAYVSGQTSRPYIRTWVHFEVIRCRTTSLHSPFKWQLKQNASKGEKLKSNSKNRQRQAHIHRGTRYDKKILLHQTFLSCRKFIEKNYQYIYIQFH